MSEKDKKTKIIAIEGIDGSGKSLQFQLLSERLEALGKKNLTLSFPAYEGFFGREIGAMLSGKNTARADNVDAKSMSLWYAVDRLSCMRNVNFQEYGYILLNRYTLSNAVYQSLRVPDTDKRDFAQWVFDLEHRELALPVPDKYIVLDVEEQLSAHNVKKKGFRDYVGEDADVYEKSGLMMARARQLYLDFAGAFQGIEVIACSQDGKMLPPENIHEMIWKVISEGEENEKN